MTYRDCGCQCHEEMPQQKRRASLSWFERLMLGGGIATMATLVGLMVSDCQRTPAPALHRTSQSQHRTAAAMYYICNGGDCTEAEMP